MIIKYISACGNAQRMVITRLLPGCDIIGGLIDVCRTNNIRAGAVVSAIGSIRNITYQTIVPDKTSKTGARFGELMSVEGPIEFISAQGTICADGDDIFIHFHAVMMDKNGKVFGGHIEKGDNPVLNTLEVTIIEGTGLQVDRVYDDETGFVQSLPREIPRSL